jgi:xanthine dehydrogenase accessory factor
MQFLIESIHNLLCEKKAFVLLTIISREGSSPRGVGACMLVTADGSQKGTIGGGAVEYEAGRHAMTLFSAPESQVQTYILNPNQIADLGMVCGGRVEVLFQYLSGDGKENAVFETLFEHWQAGETACLVRRIENGRVLDMEVETGGDLPEKAVFEEGVLMEPVVRGSRVYVFGGGHVSQKLVPLLGFLDYRVTVCEDRPEFADETLFPAAEGTVLAPFEQMMERVQITARDYCVVMTRGHQADYEILRQLLKTPAFYIGCIGSRHKVAVTRQRLLDEGFSQEDFDRIHTPIGLNIGAETPEEIAVSIAAEMIQCKAGRS